MLVESKALCTKENKCIDSAIAPKKVAFHRSDKSVLSADSAEDVSIAVSLSTNGDEIRNASVEDAKSALSGSKRVAVARQVDKCNPCRLTSTGGGGDVPRNPAVPRSIKDPSKKSLVSPFYTPDRSNGFNVYPDEVLFQIHGRLFQIGTKKSTVTAKPNKADVRLPAAAVSSDEIPAVSSAHVSKAIVDAGRADYETLYIVKSDVLEASLKDED